MRSWTDAQLVAIKTIKKRTPDYNMKIERLREEAAILSTLDHVHIICLLDDDKVGPIDYFVMEYCPGGDGPCGRKEKLLLRLASCIETSFNVLRV